MAILLLLALFPLTPIAFFSSLFSLPIFLLGFPLLILQALSIVLLGLAKALLKRFLRLSQPRNISLESPLPKIHTHSIRTPPEMSRNATQESFTDLPPRWQSSSLPVLNHECTQSPFQMEALAAQSLLSLSHASRRSH